VGIYLYAHADPVMNVDPSGNSIGGQVVQMGIRMTLTTVNGVRVAPAVLTVRMLPFMTGGKAFRCRQLAAPQW